MNDRTRRIGVLTSGGDNPGLNACIRSVVRVALAMDAEIFGIHQGFDGLINGYIEQMNSRSVSNILGRGGTILGTARCPEFFTEEGRLRALRTLKDNGIEGVVVIGGNGSLRGALELHRMGFPVMGVPGTIDNDVNGTDISVGVDTALNTIIEAIDKIKDTASSHNRTFLIETMGRNSGYLALSSGLAGGAEAVLIPEVETSFDEIIGVIRDSYVRGKSHCIIVVAEGWKPGTRALAEKINEIGRSSGFSVRVTQLGHVQRGGDASAFDRILATRLGSAAAEALLSGRSGEMVGILGSELAFTPLNEAVAYEKQIDRKIYDLAGIMAK